MTCIIISGLVRHMRKVVVAPPEGSVCGDAAAADVEVEDAVALEFVACADDDDDDDDDASGAAALTLLLGVG